MLLSHFLSARRYLIVPAILVLLLVLVSCGSGQQSESQDDTQSQEETSTVKVGTIPIDAEAQVFYAKDKGYFKEVGLDVKIQSITNGSAIVSAVQSGSLDVGVSNVVSIATAIERGLPLNVIAPGAIYSSEAPSTVLMVVKDSPIQSAEDLNGKVVAVNGLDNITQVGAQAWIDKNGGDSSTVDFIELPFPQMGAALEEGRTDAAVVAEPALTQAKDVARTLGDSYSAIADEFLITGYFATNNWVEENPRISKKFAQAILKANKWANENPEESAKILENYTQISAKTANEMTRATNAEAFNSGLIQSPIDSAENYEVLKQPLDAEKLVPKEAQ